MKEYFYVTFMQKGTLRCIVLPQEPHPGGGICPDGMNFANAYSYLTRIYGKELIITSWKSVSERRASEFYVYLESQNIEKAPVLKLVKEDENGIQPADSSH